MMDRTDSILNRKTDHLAFAMQAQMTEAVLDRRFYYEPLLGRHSTAIETIYWLDVPLKAPLWISSMTGGTDAAQVINQRLAKACGAFGLSMGLGSCRVLLKSEARIKDFAVRNLVKDQPLFANLGIAQVEQAMLAQDLSPIHRLVSRLEANGLIVHMNPLQEWLQPEGDRFVQAPIDTLQAFLRETDYPVVVKEVGQGMGPASIEALLKLPLAAIEFGAWGGTNFSMLEAMRRGEAIKANYEPIARVGHDAEEMVGFVNEALAKLGSLVQCPRVIVSGGVKDFVDAHYLLSLCALPALYGQAAKLLLQAQQSYEALASYIEVQLQGLALARSFLKVRGTALPPF